MSNKEKAKLVIRYSQAIIFDIVINALQIVLIALYHMQIWFARTCSISSSYNYKEHIKIQKPYTKKYTFYIIIHHKF